MPTMVTARRRGGEAARRRGGEAAIRELEHALLAYEVLGERRQQTFAEAMER